LKFSAAAAAGLAASPLVISCRNSPEQHADTSHPHVGIDAARLPLYRTTAEERSALARRFPWLSFGQSPAAPVQIACVTSLPQGIGCDRESGHPGERTVRLPSGARVLPWAPMFPRPTQLEAASAELTPAGAGRLFIKDEGSVTSLLYGNKIRKYEFTLPNLAASGIDTIRSHGAYGSNHCAYLTLAARYGRYRAGGAPGGMNVELFLYPQELSGNVITKLRLLVASGARLRFLDGDTATALSIAGEELRSRSFPNSTVGYVAPGGSSPLSVLGHVEAVMELAEQMEEAGAPLDTPPDYIFVPLGSGATAMGLVLGCYLLGWKTTVVGTCSQDKGRLARLAVNGDAETPFLEANAASLLEKSLSWIGALGLQRGKAPLPSSRQLLRSFFTCDSETWHPGYGKVTPEIARESAAAGSCDLVLDNTFTAKSFHTLKRYAEAGLLRNKTALFWNTYQRFPLESILPQDDNWRFALPDPVRGQVEAFLEQRGGRPA
jgi:D-cysteine desulfhydrase